MSIVLRSKTDYDLFSGRTKEKEKKIKKGKKQKKKKEKEEEGRTIRRVKVKKFYARYFRTRKKK